MTKVPSEKMIRISVDVSEGIAAAIEAERKKLGLRLTSEAARMIFKRGLDASNLSKVKMGEKHE